VLIIKFAEENVLEMLVLLSQSVEEEENRNWNLLLLDIFSLMFVREDPAEVIGSADAIKGNWHKSERRKELLANAPKPMSVHQRRAKCAIRNSRFTGTFKTHVNNGVMYLGATPTSRPDPNGQNKRKISGRNKKEVGASIEIRSAVGRSDVLLEIDKFAHDFVEVGFNALIGTVTYDMAMESAALERNDDINFTALSSWIMRYHRLREKTRIVALPKRPKPEKAVEATEAKMDAVNEENNEQLADDHETTKSRLEMTAQKLMDMLRDGEKSGLEVGGKEGEKDAGAGMDMETHAGENDKHTRVISDTDATAGKSTSAETSMPEAEDTAYVSKWAALPSVVSWNVCMRRPVRCSATQRVDAEDKHKVHEEERAKEGKDDGEQDKKEATTPDNPPAEEEPLDPYDFHAGAISAIIDKSNLQWVTNKVHSAIKPIIGDGKPQWEKLPALVALMKEMVNAINLLYFSKSKNNKEVAGKLLRDLVYEWDFGETLLTLIKEYRPFRNSRAYFADVVDVQHTILKLLKSFCEENPHLQRLRKRRRTKHNKKKVQGKEGDGEWLEGGGSDVEEFEEEEFEETEFNFQQYMRRFASCQVVEQYVWLLSKVQPSNTQIYALTPCESNDLRIKSRADCREFV